MSETCDAIDLLTHELKKRKQLNPNYSLRSFARALDMSPSRLSEALARKRPLTSNQVKQILARIRLAPEARQIFLETVTARVLDPKESSGPHTAEFHKLAFDESSAVAEWQHFALMSLLRTRDCQPQAAWLAKQLGISTVECRDALARLVRLGLVRKERHTYHVVRHDFETTTDVPSEAVRDGQRQRLQLAAQALEDADLEAREFAAMTMAIDRRKVPEAKEEIRKFLKRMSHFLESGERTDVYNLNMQLFPLGGRKSK